MIEYGTKLSDYDYKLPPEFIAQHPLEPRDHCKLMLLNRHTGKVMHTRFDDIINYLRSGDLMVINETHVFPARLLGQKPSGGKLELLLLEQKNENHWKALVKPARRFKPGQMATFGEGAIQAKVIETGTGGERLVEMTPGGEALFQQLDKIGHVPLPPYIRRADNPNDRQYYQTVYAKNRGSVAAPTAGLHFTAELLEQIKSRGIPIVPVTLHIGLDTFRPVSAGNIRDHRMHTEYYAIPAASADRMNRVREQGGRIIAVGTTSVRTLETAADEQGRIKSGSGWSQLFIYPGYHYKAVDAIITNFHLPKSSLLMMIAAFASLPRIKAAYREALAHKYRFFSYGDAMMLF